ncbi:C39 family peptidase [Eupransor demetentiae]|uniref:Glucan-binding domain (YG repeat) n=1 Tax=Eupransor demetentiae TaxID=3109584 RepID=A0ABM9N5Q9_9LACO|nr:Glucan-binding domain (YG repeat) [Lactobacillaceae bacterium LMG 33000]
MQEKQGNWKFVKSGRTLVNMTAASVVVSVPFLSANLNAASADTVQTNAVSLFKTNAFTKPAGLKGITNNSFNYFMNLFGDDTTPVSNSTAPTPQPQSQSTSTADNGSTSTSMSTAASQSVSQSTASSATASENAFANQYDSFNNSLSKSTTVSTTASQSASTLASRSASMSVTNQNNASLSNSLSTAKSSAASQSASTSKNAPASNWASLSDSVSQLFSQSTADSQTKANQSSTAASQSASTLASRSNSMSVTNQNNASLSNSLSTAKSSAASQSASASKNAPASNWASLSDSVSRSQSTSTTGQNAASTSNSTSAANSLNSRFQDYLSQSNSTSLKASSAASQKASTSGWASNFISQQASTSASTSSSQANPLVPVADGNQFYTVNGDVYYRDTYGRNVTGDQVINGRNMRFFNTGKLDWTSVNIALPHTNMSQLAQGAPEGCEGTSFQMALSAKGKTMPYLSSIYNTIGYGWDVSPWQGFHGNPFGYNTGVTQTVFAGPLAAKLNNVYGVQTKDMTGATIGDVIAQLAQGNPVITYIPWDHQITGQNNYHVQLIYGYSNGNFLIADPYPIINGANYAMQVDQWHYLNQNIQPVGYYGPAGMNVAVQ